MIAEKTNNIFSHVNYDVTSSQTEMDDAIKSLFMVDKWKKAKNTVWILWLALSALH